MTGSTVAIEAALAANDIAGAAALAEVALAAGENGPLLLNLAAWAREEAGDFADAHDLLERALKISPNDSLIMAAIGSVLRKQGLLGEAVAAIDRALTIEPTLPSAWLDRGYALEAGGSIALAEESFARSVAIDPDSATAWGALAGAAARQGKLTEARAAAGHALAIDDEQVYAAIALARADIEDGAPDHAAQRLRALIDRPALPPADRLIALGLLGDALDRSGDAGEAFAAYAGANELFDLIHADAIAGLSERQADFVARIDRDVAAIAAERWRPAPAYAGTTPGVHAFLLGFPRSGTTLVENILASLPHTAALEERPTLQKADIAFLTPADGMARLSRLDDANLYQRAYWDGVAAAGIPSDTHLFVDMDPMKGIRLPIIAKMFPQAKVIVMRRDPREVVWSCFRTNFAPSGSATEFTTLERAARLYDAMMRLTERCLTTMAIDAHVLRYDRLVEDFDATTRQLCDFLGVEWREEMRAFDRTAQARGVTTASVGQVRRGLYDGRGQWEPYAAEMAGVMPILQPWIEKFGFER